MSGKPFDLAAAKRGEKVQYNYGVTVATTAWMDAHFVGTCKDGTVAVHAIQGGNIFCPPVSSLRMAPKPQKEMWVQLFASMTGVPLSTSPKESPDAAKVAAAGAKLLGEPQPVLVPDES